MAGKRPGSASTAFGHGVVRLIDLELRRITRFHGRVLADPLEARRSSRYLVLRSAIGLLGAGVVLLLILCLVVALNAIFDKLGLANSTGLSRRVVAVLKYLGS